MGKPGTQNKDLNVGVLLDKISEGFTVLDGQDNYTYINNTAADILNVVSAEMIGKNIWDLYPSLIGSDFQKVYKQVVQSKKAQTIDLYYEPWNRWFENRLFPLEDGIALIFNDITDKRNSLEINRAINSRLELLERFIDVSKDAFQVSDEHGRLVYLNKTASERLGIKQGEAAKFKVKDFEMAIKTDEQWYQHVEQLKTQKEFTLESTNINVKTGKTLDIEVNLRYEIINDMGYVIAISRDISERKAIQHKIQLSQENLKTVLDCSGLGFWIHDLKANRTERSLKHDLIFGLAELSPVWNRKFFIELVHPIDRRRVLKRFIELARDGGKFSIDYRIIWPNGSVHWVLSAGEVLVDAQGIPMRLVGIVEDITSRKEAEIQIRNNIKEKETLLAEVHHRVKNNLAVVCGLMQLQTYETKNDEVVERLTSSINRVKSIALIHEELYKSHNFSRIMLNKNIRDLVSNIANVADPTGRIVVSYDMDVVFLSLNKALPCALIVNEVVTNCYKHAFKIQDGRIKISLKKKNQSVVLKIEDNGEGIQEDTNSLENTSMGFNLMYSLTSQIDGTISFKNKNGLTTQLEFDMDENLSKEEKQVG